MGANQFSEDLFSFTLHFQTKHTTSVTKQKLTKSPGYLQFVLVRGSVRDSKKRKQPSSDCDFELEEAPKRLKLYDLGHVVRV